MPSKNQTIINKQLRDIDAFDRFEARRLLHEIARLKRLFLGIKKNKRNL